VKVNDSKASLKTNVALGFLLIAAVLASYKDAGKWAGLFLAVALAVAVGRLAYERGYEKGQRDLLDPSRPLTEDQRNTLLMRLTLSAGRRYFGWIVMIGSLIIGQSLPFLAAYFFGGSWTFVALVPGLLVIALGMMLSDRIWKPYRDAQRRAKVPPDTIEPRGPKGGGR